MFTGLVQTTATIAAIERHGFGIRLHVDCGDWLARVGEARPVAEGDSIAVSGVCLSVERIEKGLWFDVVAQTLASTTLGQLEVGDRLNIEPAVEAGRPMGGHFVQGHIDDLGRIVDRQSGDQAERLTIEAPSEARNYLIPKGSIAIDGVSLTIAAVEGARFDIALIPTTLERTTLGQRQVGDRVNLEADMVVKAVHHAVGQIARQGGSEGGLSMDTLRKAGFV